MKKWLVSPKHKKNCFFVKKTGYAHPVLPYSKCNICFNKKNKMVSNPNNTALKMKSHMSETNVWIH